MHADLERRCAGCNALFWWSAGEQLYYQERDLLPPKRCPQCRDARRRNGDVQQQRQPAGSPSRNQALVPIKSWRPESACLAKAEPTLPALPDIPGAFTNRAALFADIEQLLDEATAPVVARRRSFFEWLGNVDPKAKQLAKKMEAAQTADELAQQRTALFEHLQQMVVAATNADLARMEAQIRLKQAQLRMLELQEQIAQRQSLAAFRLQTQQIRERVDQMQLWASLPKADDDQSIISDHRRNLRSRVKAGQGVLSDFLEAIEEVCSGGFSVHEKALRIRKVLDVFEMSEDGLPERARRVLEASEAVRQ